MTPNKRILLTLILGLGWVIPSAKAADASGPTFKSTLLSSNLWGTAKDDETVAIARDKAGNVFTLLNSYDINGKSDMLLVKVNPAGDQLLGGMALGGEDDDWGMDMAVDGDGNVIVLGTSNSWDRDWTPANEGFPLTPNAFYSDNDALSTTVITKISPNLDTLLYSSRFQGNWPKALALDAQGNALIVGQSKKWFPETPGVIQSDNRCPDNDEGQPFLAKFDFTKSEAESLAFATFLTGTGCGEAEDLAVDSNGNAYMSLYLISAQPFSKFPKEGPYLAKINANGSKLLDARFLEGDLSRYDTIGTTVDAKDNLYLTGRTRGGIKTTANAYQPEVKPGDCGILNSHEACPDAFLSKYDPNGTLVYSTYLGGSKEDIGFKVSVDAKGNAYLVGTTDSTDFPLVNPVQDHYGGGNDDAFVAVFDPNGQHLAFSTYLGGAGFDWGQDAALDEANRAIYVHGYAQSKDFPVKNPLAIDSLPGNPDNRDQWGDVFLTKIGLEDAGDTTDPGTPTAKPGDVNGDGKVTVTDATLALRIAVNLTQPTPAQLQGADINGDGKVTVSDATKVLRMAVGLSG